jgi:signal transduction histidine kinase
MEQLGAMRRSQWMGPLLLASFALTVLSFLLSTVVTERRARGIEEAADSIANNAMPSILQLAEERNDLRHMEGFVIEYAHRVAAGDQATELVPRIRKARAAMAQQWSLEEQTPLYPGEAGLWVEIRAATEAVDAAVERILRVQRPGQGPVENMVYTVLRPAVDRLSQALLVDIQFNARHAVDLAAEIETSRSHQRRLSILLDGICAALVLVMGVALARLLRGYTALMDTRITELERFNGRVAHDIRSPLTAVTYALEWTRQRYPHDEQCRETLDRASRSVQRIVQVVDAMLMLARASAPPPEDAKVEVQSRAREAIDELSPAARAVGVELELDPFEPVEVACTPGVLTSILGNLIDNAIKYIGDAPVKRVRVGARVDGAKVRIEVVDTGPGVPPEHRQRIFDPYVRAASPSIRGFGLGLATVRRLVEAHGGAVGVEPGPGGGSRFWVELPRARSR